MASTSQAMTTSPLAPTHSPSVASPKQAPAAPNLPVPPSTHTSPQFLQLFRPPSLPPIYEMSRPELKLAGGRLRADVGGRPKKGVGGLQREEPGLSGLLAVAVAVRDVVAVMQEQACFRHMRLCPRSTCACACAHTAARVSARTCATVMCH